MTAVLVVAVLAGWIIIAAALGPLIGATIAGRRMTPTERASLAWGGLGLAMALFLCALLLIGLE